MDCIEVYAPTTGNYATFVILRVGLNKKMNINWSKA